MVSKPTQNPAPGAAAPDESSSDAPLELSIEDTAAQLRRGLRPPGGRPAGVGYNPYDVAPAAGGRSDHAPVPEDGKPAHKPTDLRKLSEWIKLQRRVQALKSEESEAGAEPGKPGGNSGTNGAK